MRQRVRVLYVIPEVGMDNYGGKKNRSSSHPMRKDVAQLLEWCVHQGGQQFDDNEVFSPALRFSPLGLGFHARPLKI
jgi:hypothetical protein